MTAWDMLLIKLALVFAAPLMVVALYGVWAAWERVKPR